MLQAHRAPLGEGDGVEVLAARHEEGAELVHEGQVMIRAYDGMEETDECRCQAQDKQVVVNLLATCKYGFMKYIIFQPGSEE